MHAALGRTHAQSMIHVSGCACIVVHYLRSVSRSGCVHVCRPHEMQLRLSRGCGDHRPQQSFRALFRALALLRSSFAWPAHISSPRHSIAASVRPGLLPLQRDSQQLWLCDSGGLPLRTRSACLTDQRIQRRKPWLSLQETRRCRVRLRLRGELCQPSAIRGGHGLCCEHRGGELPSEIATLLPLDFVVERTLGYSQYSSHAGCPLVPSCTCCPVCELLPYAAVSCITACAQPCPFAGMPEASAASDCDATSQWHMGYGCMSSRVRVNRARAGSDVVYSEDGAVALVATIAALCSERTKVCARTAPGDVAVKGPESSVVKAAVERGAVCLLAGIHLSAGAHGMHRWKPREVSKRGCGCAQRGDAHRASRMPADACVGLCVPQRASAS
jgi:hypothetical protein